MKAQPHGVYIARSRGHEPSLAKGRMARYASWPAAVRLLPILFVVSLACCASPSRTAAPATPRPSSIEPAKAPNALAAAVDDLLTTAEKADRFSGSLVVVDGGKTVLEKSYGMADRDAKKLNTKDGIFRLGSVSKQFTATAILTLAEEGKLAVEDPLRKYLPELPRENFSKDGVDVTLHHLLSHTSGIGDARSTPWFKERAWFRTIDPKEYVAVGAQLPMKRQPGTKFEYSNWGYYLLGLVVERVSGQAYADFMRARFFGPLGMNDTVVLRSSLSAAQQARLPYGYNDEDGDGELTTLETGRLYVDRDMTMSFGSGQILSTTTDLVKWDRAIAAKQVLPNMQDVLFQPVLGDYACGWFIETHDGTRVEWHNGALSPLGFTAFLVRVPSKDRFVAYLANLDYRIVARLERKVITLAAK
jgi:CubicO group peptidase (beta-lactamase class C family)